MDPVVVRWESLGVVVGAIALSSWALFGAARKPADEPDEPTRALAIEISRPGERAVLATFVDGALIGRGHNCNVILDDATVSKEHARLRVDGSRVAIEDLHSTNGTLVNGRAIDGPTLLKPGDRIGFGANVIWFLGEMPPS
ncbi:MAG TPA: FHA domain-containing protein [Candidatus Acidoferrales bacterium]|nr:FHA domain-containing protein [Candidatus Acidoferrales bacterium]